jgi:N-acetylglutamate synthase-like GNAT family acetyltransferase
MDFLGDNMDIFTHPDESSVKNLLCKSGLPTVDITAHHMEHFFGCGSGSKLKGVVGLELYAVVALLRSLAVASYRRGAGLGSDLVVHAERYAREQGAKSLYLLTTPKLFSLDGAMPASRETKPPRL